MLMLLRVVVCFLLIAVAGLLVDVDLGLVVDISLVLVGMYTHQCLFLLWLLIVVVIVTAGMLFAI